MSDKNKKLFDFIEEILTKDEPSPETKNNLKRKIALSEILSKEDDEQNTKDCIPALDSDLPSDLEVGKSDVELKELLQIEDLPHTDNDKLDERIDDIKIEDIKIDDINIDDIRIDDIEVDTETIKEEDHKNVEAFQHDEEKAPSIMIVARNLNDEHKDDPTLKNLEIKDDHHGRIISFEKPAEFCFKDAETLEESEKPLDLDATQDEPRLTQDSAVKTYKSKINEKQKPKFKVKRKRGNMIANIVISLIALVVCGYSFFYF